MEGEKSTWFKCADCPKTFDKPMHYKHRKSHDRPYLCSVCSKAFGLKADMQRHKLTHMRSSTKYECKFPGCSFRGTSRKDYLLKHMKMEHGSHIELPDGSTIRSYYELAIKDARQSDENEVDLQLLEAANSGDQGKVMQLLSQIATANQDSSRTRTLLCLAAKEGSEFLAKILIDNGVDIHERSENGGNAFFIAIKAGHQNIVELLLEHGQNVNEGISYSGHTALITSVKHKHINVTKILLKYGAVDQPDWVSSNALIIAITTNQHEMVLTLLQSGHDPNKSAKTQHPYYGTTPLHAAAKAGPRMTKLLLDARAAVEVTRSPVRYRMVTPLLNQISMGDISTNWEVVKLLVEAGATINSFEWELLSVERQRHYADLFPLPIPEKSAQRYYPWEKDLWPTAAVPL